MTDVIHESDWPMYLEEFLSTGAEADYTREMDNWNGLMELETLASWQREESPDGERWADWLWRDIDYHDIPGPLMNTGRLYNSFVRGGGENIDSFSARSAIYGSDVPYAAVHQYGGKTEIDPFVNLVRRGGGAEWEHETIDVPARPMLGVRDDHVDVFADSIADSLVDQMRK